MNLPMQFQGYCWPNNPYEVTVQYARTVQEQQQPGGRSVVQNLGRRCRVIAGRGSFSVRTAGNSLTSLAAFAGARRRGVADSAGRSALACRVYQSETDG